MSWGQSYCWASLSVLVALYGLAYSGRAQVVQDEDLPVVQDEDLPVVQREVKKPEKLAGEDTEARREWLRNSLSKQITSERRLRFMNARVSQMTEAQLNRAIAVQKSKLRKLQRKRSRVALRQRALTIQWNIGRQAFREQVFGQDRWRDGFEDGILFGRRFGYAPVVAYAPAVTWLPHGATLHAHPVISSDGRHIQVISVAQFSSVGPVNTFDFASGRSSHHAVRRQTAPRVWYDGLRTRYGIPSGPFRD